MCLGISKGLIMYRKHYFSIHESFVTCRKHTKTILDE